MARVCSSPGRATASVAAKSPASHAASASAAAVVMNQISTMPLHVVHGRRRPLARQAGRGAREHRGDEGVRGRFHRRGPVVRRDLVEVGIRPGPTRRRRARRRAPDAQPLNTSSPLASHQAMPCSAWPAPPRSGGAPPTG
ncbi:MAG: hypothetical protein U1F49_15885 [Rubrivivax sp.]